MGYVDKVKGGWIELIDEQLTNTDLVGDKQSPNLATVCLPPAYRRQGCNDRVMYFV